MTKDMEVLPPLRFEPWDPARHGADDPLTRPTSLVRQHDIARDLGVSDNRVQTWRARGQFPDPCACHIGPTTRGGKQRHLLWNLGECRAWYERYTSTPRTGRKPRS